MRYDIFTVGMFGGTKKKKCPKCGTIMVQMPGFADGSPESIPWFWWCCCRPGRGIPGGKFRTKQFREALLREVDRLIGGK